MEVVALKKDEIYRKLKQAIITTKLPAGKKLPREIDLAKTLGVSRITLRSSLDRLEYEGYIKRIHGKGTFVSPEDIKLAKASTIIVVSKNDNSFEMSANYIVPEIVRIAKSKDFRTLITTEVTLLMFSSIDIKNYVKENNVVGIIAILSDFVGNEPILDELRNAGVPVILAHTQMKYSEISGFAGIAINKKEAWEMAVAYLTECGHKKIAMLGNEGNKFRGFNKQGCMELLEKYGAKPVEPLIINVAFDKALVKNAVRRMFIGNTKPTAILCFSDYYAIYVYEALKEMKLRIPGDVAVMGTCGYPDARLLSPSLSTMDYGYSKFAEMAIEMLQESEKWFSNGKGKLRIKAFKLRKRKSTNIEIFAIKGNK